MGAVLAMPTSPKVTVLMPLYNGERFLREAIDSILGQTFADFEYLIIDDGSTDTSAELVASYDDPRIRLVTNDANLGVTASLNLGIELATGEYIARMDCDDVSLPTRLAEQVAYLDAQPDCAVVAAMVTMIDENGRPCGDWPDDRQATTREAIRRFLPRANCIAHPGIMIRKSVLARYRYDSRHRVAQDYDLWLRIAADGLAIDKHPDPLLKYRVRAASVTAQSAGSVPDLKNVRTKALFLRRHFAEKGFNGFCYKVLFATWKDLYYSAAKVAVNLIDQRRWQNRKAATAVNMPYDRDLRIMVINTWRSVRLLVAVGKSIGTLLPARNTSSLFFFFPFFHVGGAEKVHADIVNCVAERGPWVFFSKRSENSKFKSLYAMTTRLFNIWPLLKYGYPLSVGIMAGFINRHRNPVVFGSNSLFFYLMIPYLKPQVRCIDLLHAFGGGSEHFSLPVVERLDCRVTINEEILAKLKSLYTANGVDPSLLRRTVIVENMVQVPEQLPTKGGETNLRVLYVGRGGTEKRVHLVGRAARLCREQQVAADFMLVGDLEAAVDGFDRGACAFLGEVADPVAMHRLYAEADLLLLTSSREGFPLVIMEAMANGVVPVCTDVGGIFHHVRHGTNGFLVANGDEGQIVSDVIATVRALSLDRERLNTLSGNAFEYARTHFSPAHFRSAYRTILQPGNPGSVR